MASVRSSARPCARVRKRSRSACSPGSSSYPDRTRSPGTRSPSRRCRTGRIWRRRPVESGRVRRVRRSSVPQSRPSGGGRGPNPRAAAGHVPARRLGAPATPAGSVSAAKSFVEDAQAGFLPAVLDDHPAHHVFEAGRAEAVAAGQVAAVTVDDHRQCGDPGLLSGTVAARCPARPARRIREDRASADLTRRLGHQLFAAMPRCRSRAEVSSTGSGSYLKYRGGQSLLLGADASRLDHNAVAGGDQARDVRRVSEARAQRAVTPVVLESLP